MFVSTRHGEPRVKAKRLRDPQVPERHALPGEAYCMNICNCMNSRFTKNMVSQCLFSLLRSALLVSVVLWGTSSVFFVCPPRFQASAGLGSFRAGLSGEVLSGALTCV